MNPIIRSSPKNSVKKVDCLSCIENGLLLVQHDNTMASISYSDIIKVYIKKQKLEPRIKLAILILLMAPIATSLVLLPMEMVLISLFLYLPIVVWMYDFKSYRLQLIDKSQTLYFKKFSNSNKQEYINLANAIRKEIFKNKTNLAPEQFQAAPIIYQPADEIFTMQSLRIV